MTPTWRTALTTAHHTITNIQHNYPTAHRNITDMLPGLTGSSLGATTTGTSRTSIVETLALKPSPEHQALHQLEQLPTTITNQARQLHNPGTTPTTPHACLTLTQHILHHLTTQPTKPHTRHLDQLLQHIWQLDNLATHWALGAHTQAKLRAEAGGPAVGNDEIWCLNCRQQGGYKSPRHSSGIRFCKFCYEFSRTYDGLLPDRQLIDIHVRRRLNLGDIQNTLIRLGSKRQAKPTDKT
jgi:hypothetical protein